MTNSNLSSFLASSHFDEFGWLYLLLPSLFWVFLRVADFFGIVAAKNNQETKRQEHCMIQTFESVNSEKKWL
jgi:hypothetical protein